MSEIRVYNDINKYLKDLNVSPLKHPLFHVVKFEDHDYNNEEWGAFKHDFFEISLSIGYDANVSIDQSTNNVLHNNLLFNSPHQIIKWDLNEIQEETTGYMLIFRPEFLPFANNTFSFYETFPYFNRNTLSSYQLTPSQKAFYLEMFAKIYQEFLEEKSGYIEIIQSYLTEMLFISKRELIYSESISYLQSRADEITFKFENLVKTTKHKRQPIKFYADQLSISSVYLAECIKKVTNKTAKQIIDEYVILEATSLLTQSNFPITQIGYALGFEDNSNFIKYFKKQTGQTPKGYKQQQA